MRIVSHTRTLSYSLLALLIQVRPNDLRERSPCPVQPRLHGPEIDSGNLRNFFVTLALELAQAENQLVMLRQLLDCLLDQVLQKPLTKQIVRPVPKILELERTVIRL